MDNTKKQETILESIETDMVEAQEPEKENDFLLVLNRPFSYEGKTYQQLDLSGLEDLTTGEYAKLLKEHERLHGDGSGVMPEYEMDFAAAVCEKVTGLPRDLFLALPAREGAKLRRSIMRFFLM